MHLSILLCILHSSDAVTHTIIPVVLVAGWCESLQSCPSWTIRRCVYCQVQLLFSVQQIEEMKSVSRQRLHAAIHLLSKCTNRDWQACKSSNVEKCICVPRHLKRATKSYSRKSRKESIEGWDKLMPQHREGTSYLPSYPPALHLSSNYQYFF